MARAVEKKKSKLLKRTQDFLKEHKTETLVGLIAIAAVLLVSFKLYDNLTTSLTVRDSAAEFAEVLREARAVAGERHIFVAVNAESATPSRTSVARVMQGPVELTACELPKGVSTDGTVTFGPYGVPVSAKNFIVRKGDSFLTVIVNEHGLITIPAQ